MAVTATPIFPQTPQCASIQITAANTARDGSGVINTVCTIGANGGYVKRLTFKSCQATAAATSAMVGKFLYSTDGGTTWRAIRTGEIAIPTVTASTTAIGAEQSIPFADGLQLPANAKVGATITVRAGVQD